MAGPGDKIAAGARDHGHLRVSHADREQVIDALKAAFVRGVLAKDELDLRVGQTFASRTYAELAAVTADLPARLTADQPTQPARAQGETRVLRLGVVTMAGTAVYAAVWPLAFLLPQSGPPYDHDAGNGLVLTATFFYFWFCSCSERRCSATGWTSVPVASYRGDQHRARAVSHRGACHQPTRVGSSRRSITIPGIPPKQHEGVFPGRHRRFAVTAPVAPSRQGRLRRAGDCGPGPPGQHPSQGSEGLARTSAPLLRPRYAWTGSCCCLGFYQA